MSGKTWERRVREETAATEKKIIHLEVAGKSNLLASPDEPLGGVILVPLDSVAIVHGELVMEVVVAFSNGDESSGEMIAGCVLVIEGSLSEPVSERVNTEGGLLKGISSRTEKQAKEHPRGERSRDGGHRRTRIHLERRPTQAME